MSLTAEQRAIRETGIGASEIAAVVELSPYRSPIDVWLAKPTRSRAAITMNTDNESPAMMVGNELEGVLLDMYSRRSGVELVRPHTTLRHARAEHVLASPDGLASREDLGAEAKVVGARMAHHWDSGPPDYVVAQCVQSMAVTERAAWDIVALIDGTDLRIYRVERDVDLEARFIEAASRFWTDYVVADVAPAPRDVEEQRRYLAARYPAAKTALCRDVGDGADGEIAELVRWLREARARKAALIAAESQLEASLCELVGDAYGIEGPWGRALWFQRAGQVSWKGVAEELAGGVVAPALIEKHRGKPGRTFALYEPSARKGHRT